MVDIIKLLTSSANWMQVVTIFVAMALYVVITDQLQEHINKLPMPNISVPIIMATIFTVTFGMVFKQNAVMIFTVILAFGLFLENRDYIDTQIPQYDDSLKTNQ